MLRQLSNLKSDKHSITVGFIGYPNVGKSSIINVLKNKGVCKPAPIPGQTKFWQTVKLMKRILLIDSPGFICDKNNDSDTDLVLRGVVRVENLEDPTLYIPEVLQRVDTRCLQRAYQICFWENTREFLLKLANRTKRFS